MSGVERYMRPQTVAEAVEPLTEAMRSPVNRLRVHLASAVLGRRLFRLQRAVWKAEGERDAWLHTVKQRAQAEAHSRVQA